MTDTRLSYRLGLPAWAFPGWKGRYWSAEPTPLASYSALFGTVEGNTSFYRIPDPRTVAGWREAVADRDFHFCFKLPRSVTHERRRSDEDLTAFLDAIEPLGEKLGPLLVQFPATTGPADLSAMDELFTRLSSRFRYAVEVRHPRFFTNPELLEPLIERHGCGRVTLDSRPLYGGDPDHPDVVDALHEKPDVPVLDAVYNDLAFVRLILHPDARYNGPCIEEWADRVARCLGRGQSVYMMIHCPNNLHCPPFARDFHEALRRRPGMQRLPGLAPWPLPQQATLL